MKQFHSPAASLLAGLICLLSIGSAQATVYYVDSVSGNDTNNGTSTTTPYKTFLQINKKAFAPGDIISLKAGSSFTGGLVITASGNATSPITFNTYGTGNAPIVQNNLTYGSYSNAVSIGTWVGSVESPASYIVLDGLKLTRASLAGVYISPTSNHNVVQNCEITNTGEGGHIYGSYNRFSYNYVHDLIMVVNDITSSNNDHGANGFLVLSYNSSLTSTNNEFSYNDLVNCNAPSYDYGTDGGAFELYGNTANVNIHHNWTQSSGGFIESGSGLASNVTIAYNVSLNNSTFLVLHTSGAFAGSLSNVKVENNTVVELTTTSSNLNFFESAPNSTQFVFRNNVVYVNNGINCIFKLDVPRNNNDYRFQSSSTHILNNWGNTLNTGEMFADPLFVNLSSGDFTLSPGSPALGAGTNLAYTFDFAGIPVPASPATPSLGAYESRVFTEDFDSYTASAALPASWGTGKWAYAANSATLQTLVQADASNLFGKGTLNKFLCMSSSSGSYGAATNTLSTTIPAGSISFKFHQPTVTGATGNGFLLRIGNGTLGNGSTAFGLGLKNGALYLATGTTVNLNASSFASYSLNATHAFTVYFNNSSSDSFPYAISGTVYTLAAGTMDVWVDGARVGTGLGKAGGIGTGVNIAEFNFASASTFVGTLYIDDIVETTP